MHTPLWTRALGASLLALAVPMSLPAQAAVAPNGMIAISALDDAGVERIVTMQPDGSARTVITADQSGAQSGPVWSPDSSRILYGSSAGAEGGATTADVWVMNADGSAAALVTPDADPGINWFDMSPSWSPDGTQFVWSTNREDGDEDIYVADIDGSNARPLIVDEPFVVNEFGTFFGIERFPAWSPDGTRIAFYESLTSNNLSLIDASGTGPMTNVAVPFGELADGFSDISWSPDGSSLLYLEHTVGNTQPLLAVSNVDTGDTFFWDLVADGYADLATPVYSPDGSQITFSAYSFESGEQVVVSIPSPAGALLAARAAVAAVPGLTVLPGTTGALTNDWAAIGVLPNCTITGTVRGDRLIGTTGDDVICGLAGNDTIEGRGGNDTILAGPGNDVVDGGPGNDVVRGDAGNDTLRGAAGDDRLNGGAGRDQVTGGAGADLMFGEDGVDHLLGVDRVRDNDTIEGGAERDVCTADHDDTRTNC